MTLDVDDLASRSILGRLRLNDEVSLRTYRPETDIYRALDKLRPDARKDEHRLKILKLNQKL